MAAPAGGRLTGIAGASPDLIRLRQARDRMDREYAEPLDVPALARTALMSPGHFSRSFRGLRAHPGSGAEVLQEPMDQPYGVRDCAFRDPAGNMLRFNQQR